MNPKWWLIGMLLVGMFFVFTSATQYHSVGVWADDIATAEEQCSSNEGLNWIGVDGDVVCRNGARFN